MTGEHQIPDDDFLDDFVLDEGVTGAPEGGRPLDARAKSGTAPGAETGRADESDLLFTDHTQGIVPSEQFKGSSFDEGGDSTWTGDTLELDDVGIPADAEAGTPIETGIHAVDAQAAEAAFSAELDSLLDSEDELGLESDQELEILDAAGGSETAESVTSAADVFVIEDGEAAWQGVGEGAEEVVERGAESAARADRERAATAAEADAPATGDESGVNYFGNVGAPSASLSTEEGWEPLPGARIDELAEVDGVALVGDEAEGEALESAAAEDALDPTAGSDEEEGYGDDPIYGEGEGEAEGEQAEAFAGPAPVAVAVAADAEGHDIYDEYEEEPAPVVVGAYVRRGRMLSLVSRLAAVLAILGVAGLAVYQPQWFGLRYEPSLVEVAQVPRPITRVDVPTPALPQSTTAVQPGTNPGSGQTGEPTPTPATPTTGPGTGTTDPAVPTDPATPAPVTPSDPQPLDPAVGVNPTTPGVPPVSPPTTPPTPVEPESSWPVAAVPADPKPAEPTLPEEKLMRINDGLLVGDLTAAAQRPGMDGVLPGTRAFAQLGNGNYFIGAVKAADAQYLTLRVAEGEVSLPREQIVRLTELGSTDYEELQKATSGFVRLTNSNRLVGAILRNIADDHIVLETRSNRVMLPKSVIDEIVQTSTDTGVRVTTTREEDEWLRKIVRRQIGQKQPATPPAPANNGK